jgi:hypothetical protein
MDAVKTNRSEIDPYVHYNLICEKCTSHFNMWTNVLYSTNILHKTDYVFWEKVNLQSHFTLYKNGFQINFRIKIKSN